MFLDKLSYFDGQKPLIIPHRGGSNIVPENTLHGLQMVISEGFTHFETDLRMSKDGEIFLNHDGYIKTIFISLAPQIIFLLYIFSIFQTSNVNFS